MGLDGGAEAALDAAPVSRRRLAAEQAWWPWSRHLMFGGLMGALVAAQGWVFPLNVLGDAAVILAVPLVVSADRRRRGVFVNGWRSGRTLAVALPMAVAALAAALLSTWLRLGGLAWGSLALGAAVVPAATAGSKLWEHIYRRELQESL